MKTNQDKEFIHQVAQIKAKVDVQSLKLESLHCDPTLDKIIHTLQSMDEVIAGLDEISSQLSDVISQSRRKI